MFNTVQKMIEEQKPNNSTETAILPMQCYQQPLFSRDTTAVVKYVTYKLYPKDKSCLILIHTNKIVKQK